MCQTEDNGDLPRGGIMGGKLMNDRPLPGEAYAPTDLEHIANSITHGLWIVPSLAGWLWMLHLADNHTEYYIALVYGASLLSLFTVSTTFHVLAYTGKFRSLKNVFHIGDRAVIYVFIASSYTPWFILKETHASTGLWAIWLVWVMAVLGISYQYTYHEQYKGLETALYMLIGVCPSVTVFAMKDEDGIYELAVGGIIYIIGVIFFKCDGILPFSHAIWHCFVFVGALFHYYAVCKYLLGAGPIPFIGSKISDEF